MDTKGPSFETAASLYTGVQNAQRQGQRNENDILRISLDKPDEGVIVSTADAPARVHHHRIQAVRGTVRL